MNGARVALVVVSHSPLIARGVRDLCEQAAPDVVVASAGGSVDGRLGTSFDAVGRAILSALTDAGVIVLTDIGSATLTAEIVIAGLSAEARECVLLVDAPLVEGALAAAVAAQTRGTLAEVAEAATGTASVDPVAASDRDAHYARTVVIADPAGLHARPAARLVSIARETDALITLDGADARSMLGVLALGLRAGGSVRIACDRQDGARAVDEIADLLEAGPGEADPA